MKVMSELLSQIVPSAKRWGLGRFLTISMTAFLLLALVNGTRTRSLGSRISGHRWQSQPTPSIQQLSPIPAIASQTQRLQLAGGANTCRCSPPIPSEASAMGACTLTQDDGTFCELTFSLSQRAAAVGRLPAFDKYAMDRKLSIHRERVGLLVDRLEENEIVGLKPEEVAASLEAVAALTAFQRPSDTSTQSHFRDIFQMLTFQGPVDSEHKAAVLRSLDRFASRSEQGAPEIESFRVPSGRTYELITAPGCITFGESRFTFMIRATGAAAPCERRR